MKSTNPVAQLKQWQKTNASKNGLVENSASLKFEESNELKIKPVNQSEFGSVKNPQSESHSEPKKKSQGKLSFNNPLVVKYSQITRQFKLIQDSNKKCLDVYPDEFHHKLKFKAEITDLIERLKGGGKLLNALAKSQGVTFAQDNQSTLKDFNQANSYLIFKFAELVEQIDRLSLERLKNDEISLKIPK